MYTHLAVVLLLAVLIDTAAATGPPLDLTLPAVPMGSYYPDPDGMLDSVVYDLCFLSCPMGMCTCFVPDQLQRNVAFPLESLYMDPGWSLPQFTHTDFVDPQENPHTLYPSALIGSSEHTDSILGGQQGHVHAAHNESQTESQPESLPPNTIASPATTNEQRKEMMRELEKDATRVEPSTVQSYVEDIYTPGDRLRQRSSKRQRPQSNGFPCGSEGCSKIFSRACDVKRHQKTHLAKQARPHKCDECPNAFLYPKDLARHKHRHDQVQATLYHCDVPGCSSDGFSRPDNLRRHQKKQHPSSDTSS